MTQQMRNALEAADEALMSTLNPVNLWPAHLKDKQKQALRIIQLALQPRCEDEERKEFESAMYAHYLRRRAAGKLDPNAEGDGTPEALFWKQPNGEYGVLMFNPAWYGWRAAKGLA